MEIGESLGNYDKAKKNPIRPHRCHRNDPKAPDARFLPMANAKRKIKKTPNPISLSRC
jgi:hypothetical protein